MFAGFSFGRVIGTLSQRNFGIYAAGNAVSLVGTWMQRIAAGWLVWELTGSPGWLGAVAFADLFPAVVIGPFAGVAADRWERLRIMKIGQAIGALIVAAFTLIYFAGGMTIWVIFFLTFLLGIVDAFVQPFRLAFISALVPRQDLTSAVAIKSIIFNLSRFTGPAIAGLVIATVGVGWAFAANAMSFLIFLVALTQVSVLHQPVPRSRSGATVFDEALVGARYAFTTPGVGLVLLLLAATSFTARPVVELLPGWAGAIFGGDASDLAVLTSAIGIGAVGGGLWLAGRPGIVGLVKAYLFSCFGLAVTLLVFASSESTAVALPLMVVTGFFMVATAVCAQTLVQVNVSDDLRGRVLSIYAIIFRGCPAVGALVAGFAANFLGMRVPLVIGMALLIIITAMVLRRWGEMERMLESAK